MPNRTFGDGDDAKVIKLPKAKKKSPAKNGGTK